jgi:long-chain acyl-CoA synthetase
MEPRTLADIFFLSVAHDLDRHVMIKRGAEWQVITSRQLYGYVSTMARTFRQWGLSKGDRVAILSENRPEWMIIDFACVTTGLVDVPIYATLTAEQTLYVLENSGARIVCVSSEEQLRKVQSILSRTRIEKVVVMDDIAEINVIPIWPLLNGSSFEQDTEWEAQARTISPDDLATLIYTSGTTGNSKGVMLTHGNLTSNANMSTRHAEWKPGDLYLSFLPLSHVTARHLDYVCYLNGVTIAYCPFFDKLLAVLSAGSSIGRWASAGVTKPKSHAVKRQRVPPGNWLTSWFIPRSGKDLAAAAAFIFPEARRWASTCLTGSVVWAFPSLRVTGLPKHHR